MNLSNISVILTNTITKEWRSKTLLFLFIINIIMVSLAGLILAYFNEHFLTQMSLEALAQKTIEVFFAVINFWSFIISIYFGVSVISSDSDDSVLAQLLAFPISRGEYLLGRVLGTWVMVMLYYLLSLIMSVAGIYFAIGSFGVSIGLLWGLLMNSIPNLIVILFSILFALYQGKIRAFVSVVIFVMLMSVLEAFNSDLTWSVVTESENWKGIFPYILYWITPNTSYWGDSANLLLVGKSIKEGVLFQTIHLIFSGSILAGITYFIFKKKEV